jgi:hypothetical protein
MCYTLLREDYPWRMVSYPYYTKCARPVITPSATLISNVPLGTPTKGQIAEGIPTTPGTKITKEVQSH